jgi:hypothetical protein
MVMPGDLVKMFVELIMVVACEQGMRFSIRVGARPSVLVLFNPSSIVTGAREKPVQQLVADNA